jgi:DNA-binding response OmpR family regulator
VARVAAQLRRASYPPAEPGRLAFGPYLLDLEGRVLERHGHYRDGPGSAGSAGSETLRLSKREFELLAFLARNAGKAFGPAELYRSVWGLEHGDLSTVAVHIQRLRRKIEEEPSEPRWITTVPGAGYRFVPKGGR